MSDAPDFAYVVETKKKFDDAVVAVLKAVEQKGWALFQVYDVKERLAAKGFQHQPLKIIEICSARYASQFLSKNPLVSLCMPCKINVLEDKGIVKIAAMKPTMVSQFFPEVDRGVAEQAEKDVREMVGNAK